MPKAQMPKLKGVICNIAVSVNEILSTLLRTLDSSGIIPVKLIKTLGFSEYVYFKPVWTEKKNNSLPYLKKTFFTIMWQLIWTTCQLNYCF